MTNLKWENFIVGPVKPPHPYLIKSHVAVVRVATNQALYVIPNVSRYASIIQCMESLLARGWPARNLGWRWDD